MQERKRQHALWCCRVPTAVAVRQCHRHSKRLNYGSQGGQAKATNESIAGRPPPQQSLRYDSALDRWGIKSTRPLACRLLAPIACRCRGSWPHHHSSIRWSLTSWNAKFFYERILLIWSTKWSLFTKLFYRWVVNRETNLMMLINSWLIHN